MTMPVLCRFSDDDFTCDADVRQSERGWEVALAARHWTWSVDLPEPAQGDEATYRRMMQVAQLLGEPGCGQWRDLDPLPEGRLVIEASPRRCADFVDRARDQGYAIPAAVADELRARAGEG